MRKIATLTMILLVGLLAAGCNNPTPTPTEEPPTATLVAPSETPVPTSTPITPTITPTPTITDTPSDTPTITDTPTPTLTPTPQTLGSVAGSTGVNVRAEPDTDSERVTVLEPGATVLVLGANEDETWLEIRLADGATGWVWSRLLNVFEGTPVPPTDTPAPTFTLSASVTPTPSTTPTRQVITDAGVTLPPTTRPPAQDGSDATGPEVYILANCDEFGQGRRTVAQGSVIYIYWGWVADTRELLEEHAAHVNYDITLNDRPVGNWRQAPVRDMIENGSPARYWYVYQGDLPVGTYRVGYRATWDTRISDGELNYGPGTDREVLEFGCTFVVR
ncbi:MAG: SH3 domain-containing protein [Anaerolineae bacterium]|nr:SH3 domain-containing protein [Anaerolineae bacterium]